MRLPILCLMALAAAVPAGAAMRLDPVTVLAGRWALTMDRAARSSVLQNHCAQTGVFYACEQRLDGKTIALVVYLPVRTDGPLKSYRTQTLQADATRPGPWYYLTIADDRWTYSPNDPADPTQARDRIVNQFSGRDHIHFEVQTSLDGKIWKTTAAGVETRLR